MSRLPSPTRQQSNGKNSSTRDFETENVEIYVDDSKPQQTPTDEIWQNSEILADYREQESGVALPIAPLSPAMTPTKADAPTPQRSQRLDIRPPAMAPSVDSPPTRSAKTGGRMERTDLPATELPNVPDEPYDEYTIRYGDTLSGIAEKMLGSPGRYTDIYNANKDRMASPDRLRVGAAIRIPRH